MFGLLRKHGQPVLSDVSLKLEQGSCLALLGASGAGKSTLGRIALGLERPQAGQVTVGGANLYECRGAERRRVRRNVQAVFQDCYSAVNSRMTAAQIIGEPLDNYETLTASERRQVIGRVLEQVGLSPEDMHKYPRQFSGGQLQRINIARAIVLRPQFIVLDEPVSSLDMVNQVRILQLLRRLKEQNGMSYLFITHDIKAAFALADRVTVLDRGRLTETYADRQSMLASREPAVQRLLQSELAGHPSVSRIRPDRSAPGRSLP